MIPREVDAHFEPWRLSKELARQVGKDLKNATQPGNWRGRAMEGSAEAFGEPQKKSRCDQIYILTVMC